MRCRAVVLDEDVMCLCCHTPSFRGYGLLVIHTCNLTHEEVALNVTPALFLCDDQFCDRRTNKRACVGQCVRCEPRNVERTVF